MKWITSLFVALALLMPSTGQAQPTSDTSTTVVASWAPRHADSVRVAYSTGTTRTFPSSRRVDTLLVTRTDTPQTLTVTFTPLRGSQAFQSSTASLVIAARPQPPAVVDSARVDTLTAPSPPITNPTDFTPNLPAGMRLVGDSDFDSPNVPGIEIINWDRNTVQSPTTHGVALMNVDGRSVVRAWFPEQNAGNGVGPMTITTGEMNSRSHYMSVRLRYSANYQFHTNTEKLLYPVLVSPGAGAPLLNVGRDGELAGFNAPMNGPVAPLVAALSPAGVIPIGRWFHVEYYTRLNSPGQSDGEQRVWVDGRLVLDRRNVNFVVHGSQVLFLRGRLDFTRGGGASGVLTPLGGQWVDVDRLAFYSGN
jgi:hypothetical protein